MLRLCEWKQDTGTCAGTEINPKQSDALVSYWNSDFIRERNCPLCVLQVL